jgi:hypothetical protein
MRKAKLSHGLALLPSGSGAVDHRSDIRAFGKNHLFPYRFFLQPLNSANSVSTSASLRNLLASVSFEISLGDSLESWIGRSARPEELRPGILAPGLSAVPGTL